MSLIQNLINVIQAIAADIKLLKSSQNSSSALFDGGGPQSTTQDTVKIDFGGVQ